MTTVAWDGYTIAADRLCTDQSGLKRTVKKLHVCGPYIYAMAGVLHECQHIIDWMRSGMPVDTRPELKGGNCYGFVVHRKSGRLFTIVGETPALHEFLDPFHAEGSGRDFAMAAMAAGASAIGAVEAASKFDCYTGSEVEHIDVRRKPKRNPGSVLKLVRK